MRLQIDGKVYPVPREYEVQVFDQLWNRDAIPWYSKVENWIKVLAQPVTRLILAFLEKQVEKEAGPEKAKLLRPPDRYADPNLWLGEVMAKMLLEGLQYVTLVATTDGDGRLANFHLELDAEGSQAPSVVEQGTGEARRLLGPGRNER